MLAYITIVNRIESTRSFYALTQIKSNVQNQKYLFYRLNELNYAIMFKVNTITRR